MSEQRIGRLMGPAPDSRTEWAYQSLRHAIVTGRLKPNAYLSLKELAAEFGVSPTPLREAMRQLEGVGLVVSESNRRVRVSDISEENIRDIAQLRSLLEPIGVARSVRNGDDGWRAAVTSAYDGMIKQAEVGVEEFEIAHSNFHTTLVAECGSVHLLRFVSALLDESARYRILALSEPSDVVAAHQELYTAVMRGDVEAAQRASAEHILSRTSKQLDTLATKGLVTGKAGEAAGNVTEGRAP